MIFATISLFILCITLAYGIISNYRLREKRRQQLHYYNESIARYQKQVDNNQTFHYDEEPKRTRGLSVSNSRRYDSDCESSFNSGFHSAASYDSGSYGSLDSERGCD